MLPSFADPSALAWLEEASPTELDALPYGVIGIETDSIVSAYNRAEGALSGLTPARVIGRNFFESVAPCTNNFMVAQRFQQEMELDAVFNYVFTLRMAPTPVRLRLLRGAVSARMYLLVERRDA